MNKKIIIGIAAIIIIAILGIVGCLYLSKKSAFNIIQNVKQPEGASDVDDKTREDNKKSLVVYFSIPETDDVSNGVTTDEENSIIVVDGKVLGNTQYVAMLISEKIGADIYRIEPKIPYTKEHSDLISQAKEEKSQNLRPKIKKPISNFNDYDTIYVGYPIWFDDLPQIMYTFFESYDFSGKIVIPFSTHGGSGLADTVNIIKGMTKAKVETNAFTISRDNMERASDEVKIWLKEIGRLE